MPALPSVLQEVRCVFALKLWNCHTTDAVPQELGVPLMAMGAFGLGKSLFGKAHQRKTCYRTTSYSHTSTVEMTAVTERTFYLNPAIASGVTKEQQSFGLTEAQLEAWCRFAKTEADCSSKYRHYGCNWTGTICTRRAVPICHQWHTDYPNPSSPGDLEQCQPFDGFSPCEAPLSTFDIDLPDIDPCSLTIAQVW